MDLQSLASYYMDTMFDYWDESTQKWVLNWSEGYKAALDRFQTIYSRPIHLRTFGFPVSTVLPVSRTIRVNGTTDVYILGQLRSDHQGNTEYQRLLAGRLATGLGGGICEIHRKVTQGVSPDLGALVDTTVASHYCDTELYGIKRDAETDQDYDDHYMVMLPAHCTVQEDDFVILNGRSLRVISVYADSGFIVARADETQDERVNVVYKSNVLTHVPGSGNVPTVSGGNYTVTGLVRNYQEEDTAQGKATITYELFIKAAHIGVVPVSKAKVTYLGKVANVYSVSFDSKQSEWCLKCRV